MTEKEIIQSIIEDDRGIEQGKSTELDNQERRQPQEDCYFKTFKGVRKLLKDDLQSLYEQTYQQLQKLQKRQPRKRLGKPPQGKCLGAHYKLLNF